MDVCAIDITAEQRKTVLALLARHLPNSTAWVYGSRVKWTARPESDLDLVVFAKPEQERRVSDLREAFEESNLPFRVDLFVWDAVPEQFRKQIEAEHVVLVERRNPSVGGEWRVIPFAQLFAEPVRNGIYKKKEFHGRGTKIVNMGELFAHPRLPAVPMKRVELSESETDRFLITAGDLLFARRSLVAEGAGKCCVVLDLDEPTTFESSIIRIRLDRTKEEMARALFKSWFVDFDPVYAKATLKHRRPTSPQGGSDWSEERARAYLARMDPNIAALLPDRFVDSELGPIPEGWEVGCFGDVVKQIRDKENPLASPDAIFHHFSIPAFDENQWPKAERGENIKSQKSRVLPGVVLLSKLNPEIERVWMVDVDASDRAVCSTEFLVLQPRPPFCRNYAYCLARSPLFRQQIESLVTGTSKSHQRAPASAILSLGVPIPPALVVKAFEIFASELLNRNLAYRSESRVCSTLRDKLLPKLMSGKVRVMDEGKYD